MSPQEQDIKKNIIEKMSNDMPSSAYFNYKYKTNDREESVLMSYFWNHKRFSLSKWQNQLTEEELLFLIKNSNLNQTDKYGTPTISYAIDSECKISEKCWKYIIENTDFSIFAHNALFSYFRAKQAFINRSSNVDHLNLELQNNLILREIIESKITFINQKQLLDLKRLEEKQEIQTLYNKYHLATKINNTEHKKTIKI